MSFGKAILSCSTLQLPRVGARELGGARTCLAASFLHQDKQTLSLSNDSALDQGRALQVSLAR